MKPKEEKIHINIHHARVQWDLVQWFGRTLLGYGGENKVTDTLHREVEVKYVPVEFDSAWEFLKKFRWSSMSELLNLIRTLHTIPLYDSDNQLKSVPPKPKKLS